MTITAFQMDFGFDGDQGGTLSLSLPLPFSLPLPPSLSLSGCLSLARCVPASLSRACSLSLSLSPALPLSTRLSSTWTEARLSGLLRSQAEARNLLCEWCSACAGQVFIALFTFLYVDLLDTTGAPLHPTHHLAP